MKQKIRQTLKDCLDANVEGLPILQDMTDTLARLDKAEISECKAQIKCNIYKQICNFQRNVILTYKYELMEKNLQDKDKE